jgi:hypothetical protein
MKVVGTGAPRLLTVRFKRCEVTVLRNEIEELQGSILGSLGEIHGRGLADVRHDEIERLKDDLVALADLLDRLRAPVEPNQPLEVTAPTELLEEVIRGAAGEAVYRLHEEVDRFREDRGTPTRDELRARMSCATAAVESLIGLDYVLNHGVD